MEYNNAVSVSCLSSSVGSLCEMFAVKVSLPLQTLPVSLETGESYSADTSVAIGQYPSDSPRNVRLRVKVEMELFFFVCGKLP